ncbi:MAG: TonB-dependent receptor [Bacteroidota bacterium]
MARIGWLLIFWMITASSGWAQNSVVILVVDGISQQGIPAVEIRVSGAEEQVITTDQDGKAILSPGAVVQTLEIMHPGYEAMRKELGNQALVRIALRPTGYEIGEVILTAYENNRKLSAQAGAISVIGQREIQRDQDLSIVPILNRVPGVYMHSGALNTNRLTIRGIGARSLFSTTKIRAYFEGIPLTTGDGETTVEDLDLNLLGRVEVIKGPASSVYGAGLGGTLLFSAKEPETLATGANAHFSTGSFGLVRGGGTIQAVGENAQLQVSFHRTHSDGYRDNNQVDRQVVAMIGRWYPSDRTTVSLLATYLDQKAFIPSSIDSTTFADEPTAAAFTWARTQGFEDYEKALTGVSIQHRLHPDWEIRTSVFNTFRRAEEPRPFNILREYSLAIGTRTSLNYTGSLAQRPLRWQVGTELFREAYSWQTYTNIGGVGELGAGLSDNEEIRQYGNAFTQLEWEPSPQTILTAGLNINRTNYSYRDWFAPDSTDVDLSGEYGFPTSFSPRLALSQQLTSDLTAYGNLSHGFSPPSLSETLTPDGALNPEIQPETGWNYELGFRGRLLNQRLWLDLSVYRMDIRNLLVPKRLDADQFVGRNAGRTLHDGLELAADYAIIDLPDWKVQAFVNYTLARYRFAEFVDEEAGEDYGGNDLTGTPPHNLSAGIDLTWAKGIRAHLTYQFVDAMPLRDDNSLYSDAYQLLNAQVAYKYQWTQGHQIEVYGGINNLLDTKYASMLLINAGSFGGRAPRYFYPGVPRNYFLGLRIGVSGK